jgi:hypothetical protein
MGYEPSRTRTCDPLVKSQLLYRLSYRPTFLGQSRVSGFKFQVNPSFKFQVSSLRSGTFTRLKPQGSSSVRLET